MTGQFVIEDDWVIVVPMGVSLLQNHGHCDMEWMVSELIPDGTMYPHILKAGTSLLLGKDGIVESNLWAKSRKPGVKVLLTCTNENI